jgi:hypothetical protein
MGFAVSTISLRVIVGLRIGEVHSKALSETVRMVPLLLLERSFASNAGFLKESHSAISLLSLFLMIVMVLSKLTRCFLIGLS